ncbi:AER446Wp [Eremothecium gossypii ATCC 10895]|uniref:Multifunctional tryptophan biosynthesis protein n=1 Tax=Eremothecium gossypii (strain ATCC 10895 / CBS 109.51 / FGSC 9923 / NRRL Y-1056) TaxID=284811 RepID=Q755S2_EREGS|nr:AER446Wp [Eremothecium gossypii ATCC 10895]AAS53125.1 AER446Wp [Eremothecium gossypii ATCC 10895]
MGKRVVLIDNYDSFTWNLYEYLCRSGAAVEVHRNDKISVAEVAELEPDVVVISPGPGHPARDAGISQECIRHFAGRVPVVGVCMGQQCIYEAFGGRVESAGEIVHGKTSELRHDGRGLFQGVPQAVAVTRYHSLAGLASTLPAELEVTARTETGVVMGVRHRKYTVEGVQFHPESILTDHGQLMVRNMLALEGGTWAENDKLQLRAGAGSVLSEIYAQRQEDVAAQMAMPGTGMADLEASFRLGVLPGVVDFHERLARDAPRLAVVAEIKRASPSRGNISEALAAEQALAYAEAGVSAISVLTEPHWFKGNLQDLTSARRALERHYTAETRPALLRKDFLFSRYQILEARLAGADSVLLIVKMLTQPQLEDLYLYATQEMGLEPLVEVSNREELDRALMLKPRVIGVNNRDLNSFSVDLDTTSSLVHHVPAGTLLLALSGISGPQDAARYREEGVQGLLVGEALMRADNVGEFVQRLVQ